MNKSFLSRKTSILFLLFLLALVCSGMYFADHNLIQGELIVKKKTTEKADQNQSFEMSVHYKNIKDSVIRNSFQKVWEKYEALHQYEITLVQQSIEGSTMQAQPIITPRSLFTGVKRYRINIGYHVRDEESLKLNSLSEEVLTGWFAHELGHIMDYQQHSNLQMIAYGLKYYFSDKFKRIVEHDADYIAIANGFHQEILKTKRFILGDDRISPTYKSKIRKFYLPENQVIVCSEDKELLQPYYNL
ncbi:MAG: hypothetical protein RIC95_08025 [Vicingaceae bacterium]